PPLSVANTARRRGIALGEPNADRSARRAVVAGTRRRTPRSLLCAVDRCPRAMSSSSPVDALGSAHSAAVPRAILALAVVIALVLLAPQIDFVPMWDGWAYAECAVDGAQHRLTLYFLRRYWN